jgi:hypothetical protein
MTGLAQSPPWSYTGSDVAAKTCFCGCGARLTPFSGLRPVNSRGALVDAALARVPLTKATAAWIDDGESWRLDLADVMHRDLERESLDEDAIDCWLAQTRRMAQASIGSAAAARPLPTR